MTSRGEYFPEVDGIRFVAIVAVVLFHGFIHLISWRETFGFGDTKDQGWVPHLLRMGSYGVPMFFTLSGFVVSLPFARHALNKTAAPDLKRYYLRRVTRIEPPYIIALTVMYLTWGRQGTFPDYLASLIYSHQYFYGTMNPFASVTWSLEVEVMFYLFAPWLACVYLLPNRYLRWLLQSLVIGWIGTFGVTWMSPMFHTRMTLFEMLPHFVAGMLFADLYVCGLLQRSAHIAWDFVTAGAIWTIMKLVGATLVNVWSRNWLVPFFTTLLFIGIFKGKFFNWALRFRPVTLMGGMCYSIYLWHNLILVEEPVRLWQHLARMPYNMALAICCLVVVPVAIVGSIPVYMALERPFMNGPASRYLEHRLRSLPGFIRRRKQAASGAAA